MQLGANRAAPGRTACVPARHPRGSVSQIVLPPSWLGLAVHVKATAFGSCTLVVHLLVDN